MAIRADPLRMRIPVEFFGSDRQTRENVCHGSGRSRDDQGRLRESASAAAIKHHCHHQLLLFHRGILDLQKVLLLEVRSYPDTLDGRNYFMISDTL